MSVFQPIDPRVGNDRRKALLAKLSSRMGGQVGVTGGAGGGASMAAPGNPFRHGASPLLTQIPRELPPGLAALLGPGGIGRAMANEHSSVFGAPVPHPQGGPPMGVPHPMPPAPPMPTMPTAPTVPVNAAPPMAAAAAPVGSGLSAAPTGAPVGSGGVAPTPAAVQNPNMTSASGASGYVPLGNGMLWDPAQDVVINAGNPAPGVFAS